MLTFENHCLEGRLTFDDPFQDAGVAREGMCKKCRRACEFPCRQLFPEASLFGQKKFSMTSVTAFAEVEAFM